MIEKPNEATDRFGRLGLGPGASLAEVKRAYRRLAMDVHPDHAGSGSLPTFLAVKSAYEWIVAHPLLAEPGERRPGWSVGPAVALSVRHAPASMTPTPAYPPAARSSWPGGRWYWDGFRGRTSDADDRVP